MKISEIITDKYKLRIPPTVYYELLADVQEAEEDQEPKTGHWIFVGEENEEETKLENFRYVCSECGFSDVHGKSIYVPYCWQCGAKMAEPGESEEV